MKANELRIGNILSGKESYREVTGVNDVFWTDNLGGSTLLRDTKPVPLTVEWLDKFRGDPLYHSKMSREIKERQIKQLENNLPIEFEYEEKPYAYRLVGEVVYLNYISYNGPMGPTLQLSDRLIRLQFVHEMQNVFYYLKGIELQLK
jgi:hypothetical protein